MNKKKKTTQLKPQTKQTKNQPPSTKKKKNKKSNRSQRLFFPRWKEAFATHFREDGALIQGKHLCQLFSFKMQTFALFIQG